MKRSSHDLSFDHALSLDMGRLVPIGAIDVLPGDTMRIQTNMLLRVAPLAKPVFHSVEASVHHWYVPNRILWDDWEEFIVGNEAGHTYPVITPAGAGGTVLLDHMGCEPTVGRSYDALPIYAYNMIWNEFYRDQDLSAERVNNDPTLARVAWQKDYFTTARAAPQQGTAVEVGFATGNAPIDGIWFRTDNGNSLTSSQSLVDTSGDTVPAGEPVQFGHNTSTEEVAFSRDTVTGYPDIYADLTAASGGIDINDLRNAISLQRIAEARNFFGSRYVDYLRWYGVNPSDGRLDRPEYLGGGKQRLSFSEVLSTADSGAADVGDLFGHGIAGLRSRPIRKMFEEHGWLISLLHVRPRGVYQSGHPRRFLRRSPEDFWHREFELLPWQPVQMREIWGAGGSEAIFGYVPRYDEYRETMSYVSGTFRGGTEEDWTLAREFSSQPGLNETFVTCTPSQRIYQDTSMPEILANCHNSIQARRLVSASARMSNRAGI